MREQVEKIDMLYDKQLENFITSSSFNTWNFIVSSGIKFKCSIECDLCGKRKDFTFEEVQKETNIWNKTAVFLNAFTRLPVKHICESCGDELLKDFNTVFFEKLKKKMGTESNKGVSLEERTALGTHNG